MSVKESIKEFDKLEEKISRLVQCVKTLRSENERLKKELDGVKSDSAQRDGERVEVRKKIAALLQLVESIEE
jgi:FtsZ-binding cell division protein ZapB